MADNVIILSGKSSKLSPTSYGVAYSLNKVGVNVFFIASNKYDPLIYNNKIKYHILSNYEDDELLYYFDVLSNKYGGSTVIPTSDDAVLFLSNNKNELSNEYNIPIPNYDVIKRCINKDITYRIAQEIGVPVPKSFKYAGLDQINSILQEYKFPLILKPLNNEHRLFFPKKILEVYEKKDLFSWIKYFENNDVKFIIQEKIVGPPSNLFTLGSVLNYDSEPIATWTGHKLHQIPFDYGVATYSESIHSTSVKSLGLTLLKEIGYYGLSQVEFKLDTYDGKYKLMEINARPWFWISNATDSGINLPYILYQFSRSNYLYNDSFNDNVRWKWLMGDTSLLIKELISQTDVFSFRTYIKNMFNNYNLAVPIRFMPYELYCVLNNIKEYASI